MTENNPYATPKAEIGILDLGEIEYNEKKWYHLSGRIGRLRYLAYPMFLYFLTILLAFPVGMTVGLMGAATGSGDETLINIISFIISIPMMVLGIGYSVRRLNDLGKTGWMVLIMLIPFVNLLFWLYLLFAKGDPDANEYGAPPRPNQWYHWVLALAMPTLMIIGIIAALSLPAYSDYVQEAKAQRAQIEFNAPSFEQDQ